MTFFETAAQGRIFLLLMYAGMAAAMLYDGIALLRHHLPRIVGAALDVLWCLLTAALCFFSLAMGGGDRVRLYALLGMACGAGIYLLGIGRAGRWMIRLIRRGRERRAAKRMSSSHQ